MIDGDLEHAVPVLEWAMISFVTRTACHPALDNDILASERSIPIAACRPKDSDDGCPGGRRKMRRTGIAADEKPGGFTKRNEFFERGWDLSNRRRFLFDVRDEFFFIGTRRYDNRQSIADEAHGQFTILFGVPTFRRPVSAWIDQDIVGETAEFSINRMPCFTAGVEGNFNVPIRIDAERFQQFHLLVDDMNALRSDDVRVEKPADRFFQEIPLPADAHRRARKIGKERGFQQPLEINRAVVSIGAQRPDKFGDFLRAADAGTVSPLIRIDGYKPDVEPTEFDDDLVLSLDQPIDFGFRKSAPQLGDRRQAMDNVAKRSELHHKKPARL